MLLVQAFKKAWDKACNSLESVNILVPKGKTYYVKHINFTGPCHSGISFEVSFHTCIICKLKTHTHTKKKEKKKKG